MLIKQQHGEAHRLLGVLTPQAGRISLWAPSTRSSRRRGLAALDVFATVRLEIKSSQGRQTLDWAQTGSA